MDKVISPLTQVVKQNSKMINLVLLALIIFMLSPIDKLFPTLNVKEEIQTELSLLLENMWVRVALCLLIFIIYNIGDNTMLTLLMFLVHNLINH